MSDSRYPSAPVLLVDDEEAILTAAEVALAMAGISNVVTCQDSREVRRLIDREEFSAVTLDLVMPEISGSELLPMIRSRQPNAKIVVITGMNDLETAVDLMKQGAFDYLVKPVDTTRLVTTVRHAIENWEMRRENESLREHLISGTLESPEAFSHILTNSDTMNGIFSYIEAIAATSLPVLISGETGVGKELLAQSVHAASGRAGNFVPVNTAGLDDHLFSDTLFGHVKGAFTGAAQDRRGMIARASGGTLFLDEVGDLSVESQIKLLRLTQEREYHPLGSDTAVKTDARFVFATNRDLEDMVGKSEFRQDLYYRLRSHRVIIPPLRERPEDIPPLVDLFLERAAAETGRSKPTPPRDLYSYLKAYDYPGNVRELEGLVYDAVVRHKSGVLSLKHFDQVIAQSVDDIAKAAAMKSPGAVTAASAAGGIFSQFGRLPSLKTAVDDLIQEALRRADGNQTTAAKLLGMTRTALNKRLNRAERPE